MEYIDYLDETSVMATYERVVTFSDPLKKTIVRIAFCAYKISLEEGLDGRSSFDAGLASIYESIMRFAS
jgi:hypothetical protein